MTRAASLECKLRILYSSLALITLLLILFKHDTIVRIVSAQPSSSQQQSQSQSQSSQQSSPSTNDDQPSTTTTTNHHHHHHHHHHINNMNRDYGSDENKYQVLISDSMSEYHHQHHHADSSSSYSSLYDPSRIIPMTIHDQLFTCFIPQQQQQAKNGQSSSSSSSTTTTTSKEDDDRVMEKQLNQLMTQLNKKCMYKLAGWWIYELCINRHMRQYHQEMTKSGTTGQASVQVTMDFNLGQANNNDNHKNDNKMSSSSSSSNVDDNNSDKMQKYEVHLSTSGDAEQSYISLQYTNGTKCDLLREEPRRTEVRIYCAPEQKRQQLVMMSGGGGGASNHASSSSSSSSSSALDLYMLDEIEEPSSCSYVAKVYSTFLCGVKGFAKKKERENKILCVPHGAAQSVMMPEDSGLAREQQIL